MAHAEFRGAPSQSGMFGTGLSIGTHAVLMAIVLLYGATHAPGPGETATVAMQQFNPAFFLNRPGLGGGKGGGGDEIPAPARPAEILPTPRPDITATPDPVDVPPPMVSIPVATIDATRMLPGGAAPIDTSALGREADRAAAVAADRAAAITMAPASGWVRAVALAMARTTSATASRRRSSFER
jgi:hypothetical protein